MHNFSQEQLIQYLYGECSPILKLAIETSMKENIALDHEVKTLQRTIAQLDKLQLQSPSKDLVDKIMQYAINSKKEE